MRISLALIGIIIVAACTTTNVSPINRSLHSLCQTAPTLYVCNETPTELTAQYAKQLLDSEFTQLESAKQVFAREFTKWNLVAADFQVISPEYVLIRDRALEVAAETPIVSGQRYFMLVSIGQAANRAGDTETTFKTIKERATLVRNYPDDREWKQQFADVISTTTKDDAWFQTAHDAAKFSYAALAIDILNEAYPTETHDTPDYLVKLATIKIASGQYSEVELAAQHALKNISYLSRENRKEYQFSGVSAHTLLIESLAAQNKPIHEAVHKLRNYLKSLDTYLFSHVINYFGVAEQIAPFAPTIAAEFVELGQQISLIDDGGESFPFSDEETAACEALQNDQCLLKIAATQEAAIGEGEQVLYSLVAFTYVRAGDYDSARNFLRKAGDERCNEFMYIDESVYINALKRMTRDEDFVTAQDWLHNWVGCQAGKDPYFSTPMGDCGNYWTSIALSYANLSRKQIEVGLKQPALMNAQISLLLTMETDLTSPIDSLGCRGAVLGKAYGASFGALVMAEQSQNQ